MTFSKDMRRLSQNLLEARENRAAALAGISTKTAQGLAQFKATRIAVGTKQRQELGEHLDGLRHNVNELRANTGTLLQGMDAARETMAAQQRQQIGEHFTALRHNVAQMQHNAKTFLTGINANRRQATAQDRAALDGYVETLRNDVSSFLQDVSAAHANITAEQNQQLAGFMSNLRQEVDELRTATATLLEGLDGAFRAMTLQERSALDQHMDALHLQVANLRSETAAFLTGVGTAHETMATELHQRLGDDRAALAEDVTMLRDSIQSEQDRLHADHVAGQKVWSSLNTLIQRKAGQAQPQQAAPAQPQRTTEETAIGLGTGSIDESGSPESDDLTIVHGIGPGVERHLQGAGIFTLQQLALADPEFVRQALGPLGRLAKVEEWIAQARELSGM